MSVNVPARTMPCIAVRRRPSVSLLIASALSLLTAGCSSLPRTPHSVADASSARVLDLRICAATPTSPPPHSGNIPHRRLRGPRTYLALSGGGADGAYGAGVLNGWTETGRRPSFSIVSGVHRRAHRAIRVPRSRL